MSRDAWITLYRCRHHLISASHRAPGFCPACAPGLEVTPNTNLTQQARTERALPTEPLQVADRWPDGVYDGDDLILAEESA